jgi:alpha-D-xyloside xylohydrolase
LPGRSDFALVEVGDGIDYYFLYGPELDRVVAGYRRVTGEAPMMPKWSFGFWQSRERTNATGKPRRARRLPVAAHPTRRHRAGLAVLEDRFVGIARVRQGSVPDPDGWIKQIRQAREGDDLGLGQVLPRHRELRGDARCRYLYEGHSRTS